jgi:GxxExxY protein
MEKKMVRARRRPLSSKPGSEEQEPHSTIIDQIVRAFYTVHDTLGYGFFEKVYENALAIELRKLGFRIAQQREIKVYYDGQVVGDSFADILVNDQVILKIKADERLRKEEEAELINHLKATTKEVGLLLNFGKIAEFKEAIFTNRMKMEYQRHGE